MFEKVMYNDLYVRGDRTKFLKKGGKDHEKV